MKIKTIDFPKALLDALRDNKLVVFAGAGVSKGEPACLPNFEELVCMIAAGEARERKEGESLDEFLGRLHDEGVKVHERAAEMLSSNDLMWTDLHKSLLQLHSKAGTVRLVTTNFDCLFEQAAENIFDNPPEVFRAPALPLGHQFSGIAHVHGSVWQPDEMVLTDKDFGRAYLSEGWARRFLLELFSNFTVLFVGYSHNDVVMNYLARALPPRAANMRFVLVPENDVEIQRWDRLGIGTIQYPQPKDDHTELHRGIRGLSNYVQQRVVDWYHEITAIAENPPPPADDEETVGIIEEALEDETKTQFFTKAASNLGWIDWLDERGHLKALFGSGSLSGQDKTLSWWLADRFLYNHANKLFLLIGKHNMRLNPQFWRDMGWKLGGDNGVSWNKEILERWILLLLSTMPEDWDTSSGKNFDNGKLLLSIGQRCIKHELSDSLLKIFDAMMKSRLLVRGSYFLPGDDRNEENRLFNVELRLQSDRDKLNQLWKEGLKPNLSQVAESLLKRAIGQLEEQYLILHTWGKAERQLEPASNWRSAIEPHEQDRHPKPVDVIIDVARDCIESLASNQKETAARWCDELVQSDAPLLRRLAVHGLSKRTDLSSDDKIQWLQKHIDLYEYSIHHEAYQAVYQAYPKASLECRKTLIEALWTYRWQHEDCSDDTKFTARVHFDWFHWLHESDSTCPLAKQALEKVSTEYPNFKPKKYPDLNHWIESDGIDVPRRWTPEELLSKPPSYWLDILLSVESTEREGPTRSGLIQSLSEATNQDFSWGLILANELDNCEKWDSDFWYALIHTWSKMELDENKYTQILHRLSETELYAKHSREITDVLCTLVKNAGTSYALNLLSQANEIAVALWHNLDRSETVEERENWLYAAMNHPAGCLAYFWMSAFSLWREQQDPKPATLSDEYRGPLSDIMTDQSLPGRLGRTVLASQLPFLLAADEKWTRENLLPLFEPESDDFQTAWDGFTTWGHLNPPVAEAMAKLFLRAVTRISSDFSNQRDRFVLHYTNMLAYFAEDPLREWIPKLFLHGNQETKDSFALAVGNRLQHTVETEQQDELRKWWICWLKPYWKNRLQGMLAKLESGEITLMLDWLPHLTSVFPEAVDLAIQMPKVRLQSCWVLDCLRGSNLWQKHPEPMAKLVVYLWECEFRFSRLLDQEFIDSLLQAEISLELKKELEDIKIQL